MKRNAVAQVVPAKAGTHAEPAFYGFLPAQE